MAETYGDEFNQLESIREEIVNCLELMNQLPATDPEFAKLANNLKVLQEAAKLEQERIDVEDRTNERRNLSGKRPKIDPNVVIPAGIAATTMVVGIIFESLGNGILTTNAPKFLQGIVNCLRR